MKDVTQGAQKIFNIPANCQVRVDYLLGTDPIYVGYADRGTLTSAPAWFILKITWDATPNPTLIQTANEAVWDDRATATIFQ